MDEILKGNFKVKRPLKSKKTHLNSKKDTSSLSSELREKVLASLGGSMVYMERKKFTWDGDESS